jgi:hypothetical protein
VTDSEDTEKFETSESRQLRRQQNVNHDKPSTIVAWDPRLALELAMPGAKNPIEIFARYKIDEATATQLLQNTLFTKQIVAYRDELEASGMSYRMKARVLAEDLLPEAYEIAKDTTYPASVRADMIQWMTKIADLEPVKSNGKDVAQVGGFSLQILFAGQQPQTIEGTVLPQAIEAREMARQSATEPTAVTPSP